MERTPDAMVEMEQVVYSRTPGATPLLRDITFRLNAGEWASLVGGNGSGKSTLVRLLNGLLPAGGGRIRVDGIPLTARTVQEIRERVGIVFQNPDNQFVGMTVRDELAFGMENRGVDRPAMQRRLREYAERLGIVHLLDRHPGQLSGGQKQRVAVASVLAMEPKLVILDEAASMLDERSKRELLDLLREMKASGRYTLLSVTHDTEEMLASDRLLLLANGTIAADGRPRALLQHDDLLRLGGLRPAFLQRLGGELRRRGLDPGLDPFEEERMVEALWASISSR